MNEMKTAQKTSARLRTMSQKNKTSHGSNRGTS